MSTGKSLSLGFFLRTMSGSEVLTRAKPALIWTPARLFKNTEILCDKIMSQNHTAARDFKAGKALCYKDSGPQTLLPHETSLFPLDLAYIQIYFTVGEGRCWYRCPQERPKLCAVALWLLSSVATRSGYRRNVEAGIAACSPLPPCSA